ncbi:MAG TPA: hypothetical protein VK217_09510, partial [Acidimicrobiales bacterium]|nr:hypothetical protein [Acidimicrobiales bacterium]
MGHREGWSSAPSEGARGEDQMVHVLDSVAHALAADREGTKADPIRDLGTFATRTLASALSGGTVLWLL